ncbi:MAG: tetratricopeptide repeat protein [Deltaproteobacteria bacterium]|nr:tetratricopeptide repeat protein [Deltaproteobacteria bacterium]
MSPRVWVRTSAVFFCLSMSVGCASTALSRPAVDFNRRGAAQLARGALDEAEASLRVSLEFNDRYAEANNNLGLVYLARREPERAMPYFLRAISLNHDFAEAHNNVGLAHSQSRADTAEFRLTRAQRSFEEALSIEPRLLEARLNLCRTLLALGHNGPALDHARRAVQITPRRGEALVLRAEAALRLGLLDEARESVLLAERALPFAADVLFTRARVEAATENLDQALQILSRIAHDPQYGARATALAEALQRAVSVP